MPACAAAFFSLHGECCDENLVAGNRSLAIRSSPPGTFGPDKPQYRLIRTELNLFLSLVYQAQSSSTNYVGAALDLVLRRKALAAEALAAQRDAILGGRYTDLRASFGELYTIRAQIAQRIIAGPGPEGQHVHRDVLAAWEKQKEVLEATLVRRILRPPPHNLILLRKLGQ